MRLCWSLLNTCLSQRNDQAIHGLDLCLSRIRDLEYREQFNITAQFKRSIIVFAMKAMSLYGITNAPLYHGVFMQSEQSSSADLLTCSRTRMTLHLFSVAIDRTTSHLSYTYLDAAATQHHDESYSGSQ